MKHILFSCLSKLPSFRSAHGMCCLWTSAMQCISYLTSWSQATTTVVLILTVTLKSHLCSTGVMGNCMQCHSISILALCVEKMTLMDLVTSNEGFKLSWITPNCIPWTLITSWLIIWKQKMPALKIHCHIFWPPVFISPIERGDSYESNKNASKNINFCLSYSSSKLGFFQAVDLISNWKVWRHRGKNSLEWRHWGILK